LKSPPDDTQLEAWEVDAVDAQVETSPLHQYEGQITSYLAMVKETGKVVAKRDKAMRTLDFYRGEVCCHARSAHTCVNAQLTMAGVRALLIVSAARCYCG
jgi:hypothetical protein